MPEEESWSMEVGPPPPPEAGLYHMISPEHKISLSTLRTLYEQRYVTGDWDC